MPVLRLVQESQGFPADKLCRNKTIPMNGHQSGNRYLSSSADSCEGCRDISLRLEWEQMLQHQLDVNDGDQAVDPFRLSITCSSKNLSQAT